MAPSVMARNPIITAVFILAPRRVVVDSGRHDLMQHDRTTSPLGPANVSTPSLMTFAARVRAGDERGACVHGRECWARGGASARAAPEPALPWCDRAGGVRPA